MTVMTLAILVFGAVGLAVGLTLVQRLQAIQLVFGEPRARQHEPPCAPEASEVPCPLPRQPELRRDLEPPRDLAPPPQLGPPDDVSPHDARMRPSETRAGKAKAKRKHRAKKRD